MQALGQIDDMESEIPILGKPRALDYEAVRRAQIQFSHSSVEAVARELVAPFEGLASISVEPSLSLNWIDPHRHAGSVVRASEPWLRDQGDPAPQDLRQGSHGRGSTSSLMRRPETH